MTDRDQGFDEFLRDALAPADRPEDLAFVARVQAVAKIQDRWAAERKVMWRRFARDMVALLALGAGVAAIMTAPSIAGMASGDRPLLLGSLIIGFGGWLSLLARTDSRSSKGAGVAWLRPVRT
jgi:hypothetical protein